MFLLASVAAGGWLMREPLLRGAAHLWIVSDPISRADAIAIASSVVFFVCSCQRFNSTCRCDRCGQELQTMKSSALNGTGITPVMAVTNLRDAALLRTIKSGFDCTIVSLDACEPMPPFRHRGHNFTRAPG